MLFPPEHEIYRRRFGRNLGLGLTLAIFVVLVFGLTVVKVTRASHLPEGERAQAISAATGVGQ